MPLRQLYPDPTDATKSAQSGAAKIDIIAVHGLNPRSAKGHAWDTWREPQNDKGRLWLRDDLPKSAPDARIFLYEYDSTAVYGTDRSTFIDKASEFLEAIRIKRVGHAGRPIILMGHSLGGLLVEQALVNAHNNPKYLEIKNDTVALAFFATPHNGGNQMMVALGGVAAKIALGLGFKKGENIINTLESGSLFTDTLQEHWRHQLLNYNILSFYGGQDNIVTKESSRFGLPGDREHIVKLDATHSSVCRFGRDQASDDVLDLVMANVVELYTQVIEADTARKRATAVVDPKPVERRQHILRSLLKKPKSNEEEINFESYRTQNSSRVTGTCTWFLEHPKFHTWLTEESSSLLWHSSDAGCGKSVLSSFLIEELQTAASQKVLPGTVCHFFFKDGDARQSSASIAVRALLYQLLSLQLSLPENLLHEYDTKGDAILDQFDLLWRLFESAASTTGGPNIICILDGLDQCEPKLQQSLLLAIARFYSPPIKVLPWGTSPRLKIIISSRPDNAIKMIFGKLPVLHLRGEDETQAIEHDICLVVKNSLNGMALDKISSDVLETQLVAKADYTFLWIAPILSLMRNASRGGASLQELEAILQDTSIYHIYHNFLDGREKDMATERQLWLLLQILTVAQRPLSLVEMNIAISLRPKHKSCIDLEPCLHNDPETYFKRLCGHFIRVRHQKVYFVHHTAKDFLLGRQSGMGGPPLLGAATAISEESHTYDMEQSAGYAFGLWIGKTYRSVVGRSSNTFEGHSPPPEQPVNYGLWKSSIDIEAAHSTLAWICIKYVYFHEFQDGAEVFAADRARGLSESDIRQNYCRRYPLIDYAAKYWHYHAQPSRSQTKFSKVFTALGETRTKRFWTWFYIYNPWWAADITDRKNAEHFLKIISLWDDIGVNTYLSGGSKRGKLFDVRTVDDEIKTQIGEIWPYEVVRLGKLKGDAVPYQWAQDGKFQGIIDLITILNTEVVISRHAATPVPIIPLKKVTYGYESHFSDTTTIQEFIDGVEDNDDKDWKVLAGLKEYRLLYLKRGILPPRCLCRAIRLMTLQGAPDTLPPGVPDWTLETMQRAAPYNKSPYKEWSIGESLG